MSASLASGSEAPEAPSPTTPAAVPARHRGMWALRALLLYAGGSLALFGIPVLGHFGSHIIAYDELDPSFLMWMLAWWPHALLHGLNPFVTHAIFYPEGYNLTWSTSMPLPGLALAPITLTAGPVVSWNVFQLLCPTLSAWTAFLLCRHLSEVRAGTRRGPVAPPWAALLGGYIFGFSPYMISNLRASPNIGMVALVPVFTLLVLRRLDGRISPRRFTVQITLALTAQFLISTEVFATSTMFGAIALMAALALLPAYRPQLLQVISLLALAYGAAALLLSPYLFFFITGQHYPPGITFFAADVLSFITPPPEVALHSHTALAGSNTTDYLGLPLVVLIAAFCWQQRRRRGTALLVVCLLVPAVLALGGLGLLVAGQLHHVWLPWNALVHVPLLQYAIPARFAIFAVLPAALIVTLWLGEARGPRILRWALAVLAILLIVPDIGSRGFNTPVRDPSFFTAGTYRHYLSGRDHVLTIPAWGPSQRWIAGAGFPFPLSTGSAGQGLPPSFLRYPIWKTMVLFPYPLPPQPATELRRFLTAKRVTAIVLDPEYTGPWIKLFTTLGVRPVSAGGVLVYRLHPA